MTIANRSLGIWWPTVGSRNPRAPLQQFFARVILVHDDVNEAQAITLLVGCRLDCLLQLLLALHLKRNSRFSSGEIMQSIRRQRIYLCRPTFAFAVVDGIDQGGVVPVLDNVVWAIMYFDLDGVPSVVYEEYDALLLAPQHGGNVLRCYLGPMQKTELFVIPSFISINVSRAFIVPESFRHRCRQ